MKASFALSSLAVFASSLVSAAPQHPARADKPAAFFLAGDSTTAVGGGIYKHLIPAALRL